MTDRTDDLPYFSFSHMGLSSRALVNGRNELHSPAPFHLYRLLLIMHSPLHALKSLYVYESLVSNALWIFALALRLAVILIPLY